MGMGIGNQSQNSVSSGKSIAAPSSQFGPPQPAPSESSGKSGGQVTFPGQGGQPSVGSPNQYSNTVGQWDNANIQPMRRSGGKGKGF